MDSNNLQFDVDQHLTQGSDSIDQDPDSIGGGREDGPSDQSQPTDTPGQNGGRGADDDRAPSVGQVDHAAGAHATSHTVGLEDRGEEGGSFSRPPDEFGHRRMRRIPPKYYRIGELVDYAGVSRQTIHNYATMGLLLEAQWTKGGHRLFGQDAFERLAVIADMKADNRSMHEIRDYFRKLDSKQTLDSA